MHAEICFTTAVISLVVLGGKKDDAKTVIRFRKPVIKKKEKTAEKNITLIEPIIEP